MLGPTVMPPVEVGDIFTMDVPVYRRWWRLWEPKVRWERRTYRVTGSLTAPSLQSRLELMVGDPNGKIDMAVWMDGRIVSRR